MKLNKERVYIYKVEALESDVKEIKQIIKRNGGALNTEFVTELLKLIERKGNESIELYIKHRKSLKIES